MTEESLRRALEAQAAAVEVAPDALGLIRSRIAARRGRWWRRLLPPGVPMFVTTSAGALATAVAVFATVATCSPPSVPPNPPAATTPSPTGTAVAGGENLRVYYVGNTGQGPHLYAEFHQLAVTAPTISGRIGAVLTEMLRPHSAADPDYTGGWPAGANVRAVSVSGAVATVDIAGATTNPVDPAVLPVAVQELVWTATAVSPTVSRVHLQVDGRPVSQLWSVPIADPLVRASSDVLAPIWVIDPQQGSVQGKTFTAHIDGIAFEGTAVFRVLDSHGATVLQQTIHVGSTAVPARATASVVVTLPSGSYTAQGYVVSAKDGSIQSLDDHTFTVA